jgi:hypothetical protein
MVRQRRICQSGGATPVQAILLVCASLLGGAAWGPSSSRNSSRWSGGAVTSVGEPSGVPPQLVATPLDWTSCYHGDMRQAVRRVIPVALLLVFGVALGRIALGPEFDTPGQYDGDGDDEGLTTKAPALWAAVETRAARPIFIPWTPARLDPVISVAKPPQVLREPLGPRGPPA